MGEGEGEEQQRQRGDDAQETNDVRRGPQEDRCGATRSMGEGESRTENRLTTKETTSKYTPMRRKPIPISRLDFGAFRAIAIP
jgi:hypothetical protein